MEVEDLAKSHFYSSLHALYPDLHDRAATARWTIIVPARANPTQTFSREILEAHLLIPSAYFVGCFDTINKRTVKMDDDERGLVTGKGFDGVSINAKIVAQDSVYSSDYKPVKVWRVDRCEPPCVEPTARVGNQ